MYVFPTEINIEVVGLATQFLEKTTFPRKPTFSLTLLPYLGTSWTVRLKLG